MFVLIELFVVSWCAGDLYPLCNFCVVFRLWTYKWLINWDV